MTKKEVQALNKKSSFSGMGKVFAFTLKENIMSKSYVCITVVVSLILALLLGVVNVMMAAAYEPAKAEKVYILDETGFAGMDFDNVADTIQSENTKKRFKDTKFISMDKDANKDELRKLITEEENTAGVVVSVKDNKVVVDVMAEKDSIVLEDDSEDIGEIISDYMQIAKISNAGLSEEQLAVLLTPISVNDVVIGEESNIAKSLVTMFAPMIFSLVIYIMLLFYGQTISKCVTAEKTSKLMEYLLVSIKPNALIAGKILAMALSAILQFSIWCVSALAGFLIGDKVVRSSTPEYENVVLQAVDLIKDEASQAFSVTSLVLAILVMCLGFLFYCVVAGLVASFSQRPEGLQQLMIIYQYIVIAGFLIAYMSAMFDKKALKIASDYVPICTPFSLPANILVGNMPINMCLVSTALLLVSTILLIPVTARIYKALVLFNGSKITPDVIKKAIFGKQ